MKWLALIPTTSNIASGNMVNKVKESQVKLHEKPAEKNNSNV